MTDIDQIDQEILKRLQKDSSVTIKELAELVKEIVGFEGDIVYDSGKPDGTPQKLLDTSRMDGLGWKAKVSLREGIRRTYQFYKKEVGSRSLD